MLGLYDSGIGGLTILNQIQKQIPGVEIAYLADTKNCPLGEKSSQEILEITTAGVEFLFKKGCNLVILACNTATVTAIRQLQNNWLPKHFPSKKILGIVRPVPEFLIEKNIASHKNVMLMATPATINSKFYHQELQDFNFHNLLEIPCKGLSRAIENQNNIKIKEVLQTIFKNQVGLSTQDVMILACTHYPLAIDLIKQTFLQYGGNHDILIFDQTQLVTNKLIQYLQNHPEVTLDKGKTTIYVNGHSVEFSIKTKKLFKDLNTEIQSINV